MGRIKTMLIKRLTRKLMAQYGGEFTTDFNKNKESVSKHTDIESAKIRNTVAGYAARLVKQKANEETNGPRKSVNKEDLSQYY